MIEVTNNLNNFILHDTGLLESRCRSTLALRRRRNGFFGDLRRVLMVVPSSAITYTIMSCVIFKLRI